MAEFTKFERTAEDGDRAFQYQEFETELAVQTVRAKLSDPSEVLPFKGSCYGCLTPTKEPQRFCDSECVELYEDLKRNGKL